MLTYQTEDPLPPVCTVGSLYPNLGFDQGMYIHTSYYQPVHLRHCYLSVTVLYIHRRSH